MAASSCHVRAPSRWQDRQHYAGFPADHHALVPPRATVHGRSEVVTFDGERTSTVSFAEVARRIERLATGLASLGVGRNDRVATLMWNSQEHLEAYFAVPCMGAVLHTLNLRLGPEDLARIMVEAGDKVLLVHASLLPLASAVVPKVPSLEHLVVAMDPGQTGYPASQDGRCRVPVLRGPPGGPATTATTGRSWTSGAQLPFVTRVAPQARRGASLTATDRPFCTRCLVSTGSVMALGASERVLPLVPMFHVNAWGIPYAGWTAGATLVMPHRWLLAARCAN